MAALSPDDAKKLAAERALELVTPGMRLGLGTGSTAAHFVNMLGARAAEGLNVICVPTSERTRSQAQALSIPLATIEEVPELDLTVDGADEFDLQLRLIKGGGGAHLREKIVAMASKRMIVIADTSKLVSVLGQFPLPVEITPFGLKATLAFMAKESRAAGCEGRIDLRKNPSGHPYVSDNGNHIADCFFGAIPDPEALAARLAAIPGCVEHGLFLGIAKGVISAGPEGVEIFGHLD